jgi:hypothetical protein
MAKKAPPPPPPNVVQYPNVLTPPQDGGLETIESYQYSEVVELLSDGPIDGLVNKNGINVDGINIFEGVYFNDSPVKETSDLNYECFDMLSNCIGLKLHDAWLKPIPSNNTYLGVSPPDKSFNINYICIKTYSPEASLNFLDRNKKTEWLSNPVKSCYELFLTEICIPSTTISLKTNSIDLSIIDNINSKNLVVFDMYDLSSELYPLISSNLFNSFSYFEMPKSCVCYSSTSVISSRIQINGIGNDIIVSVWATAECTNGNLYASYQKDIIDKYFNFFAYQNKESLYNFNSVQVEFKNGSQFQDSIQSIKNIEIDFSINKNLIGAFNNGLPVQRLSSFLADSSFPPATNVSIEKEGSSDKRYIKSWPVEYSYQNNPFLICDITMSYSSYDDTTANVRNQDAYPYTHHVLNQNVECVYITIGLNQLSDTAHVDLAAVDTAGIGSTKYKNTELPPCGIGTYGQLDISKQATYWYKNTNPGTQGNPGSLGGNLPPTSFPALRNQQQSISVGSKLPSIVSFKVETGYETDSDGNKNSSYYAYRYDVFGMVQTPNTTLDFGRADLTYNKYVYSYKSNDFIDLRRKINNSYEFYPTITSNYLNIYDDKVRVTWYALRYIKTTSAQSYYFDALSDAASINASQAGSIKATIIATPLVSLYSAGETDFVVGTKIYTDKLLSEPFEDGIVYDEFSDTVYTIYEIKNSIITRISNVTEFGNLNAGDGYRSYIAYSIKNTSLNVSPTNITPMYKFLIKLNTTIGEADIIYNIYDKSYWSTRGDYYYNGYFVLGWGALKKDVVLYEAENRPLANRSFYVYSDGSKFYDYPYGYKTVKFVFFMKTDKDGKIMSSDYYEYDPVFKYNRLKSRQTDWGNLEVVYNEASSFYNAITQIRSQI